MLTTFCVVGGRRLVYSWCAVVHFNPYAYETHENPYPIYKALRAEAPVYRNDRLDFYALSRYDDCLAAFLDWETYSSARGRCDSSGSSRTPS